MIFFEGYADALKGNWGREHYFLDEVDSTNKYMLEKNVGVGAVASALSQTNGRGRSGRHWYNNPGSAIMFTVNLPLLPADKLFGLQISAGYAICDCLANYADARLKWPNDIVIKRRKLGGILTETRFAGSELKKIILGIGVNIAAIPSNVSNMAIALSEENTDLPQNGILLANFVNSLEEIFEKYANGELNIKNEWPYYSAYYKKEVSFHKGNEKFTAVEGGITEKGYLVTEGDKGEVITGETGYDFNI